MHICIYYVFFCVLLWDRSFSFHWDLGGCILMKRGPVGSNPVKLCVFSLTIVVIIFIILLLLLLLLIIIIIQPFLSIQLKATQTSKKNPQFLRWKSTSQGARDLRNCSSMEFFLKDLDPFWSRFCWGSLVAGSCESSQLPANFTIPQKLQKKSSNHHHHRKCSRPPTVWSAFSGPEKKKDWLDAQITP